VAQASFFDTPPWHLRMLAHAGIYAAGLGTFCRRNRLTCTTVYL